MTVCFALGRTLGYVCVGFMVRWAGNDYRVCWLAAIALTLAALAVLFTIREPRAAGLPAD